MNDKWRVCDGAVLGSILIFFLCLTATAQEQPPASAQVQTAVSQADAPKPPEPAPSSGAAVQTPNPSAPTPGWSFQSLSYLWFPGMNGTVGARGYTTSAHVSAADLLRNTDIGIMGAFEADHNRWGRPRSPIARPLSISPAIPRKSQSNRASLLRKRLTSLWMGRRSKSGLRLACASGI
jgi:hypothetical protein